MRWDFKIFGKRSHKQLARDYDIVYVIIGDPFLFYGWTVSVQLFVESRLELHQVVSLFAEMDMNHPILC